jgi:hypothetical protein
MIRQQNEVERDKIKNGGKRISAVQRQLDKNDSLAQVQFVKRAFLFDASKQKPRCHKFYHQSKK